jgi:HK97 family phage major capsid protein
MKTVTQYKKEIKDAMDVVAAITAKAATENRDLTVDEVGGINEINAKIKQTQSMVAALEESEILNTAMNAPAPPVTVERRPALSVQIVDKEKFRSIGEQLFAVVRAGSPGGHADPRLFNAATGLNESVPSDGGFLVQQDFSNELLQQVYQTGVLAPRCRRMQISGNSNSIKINGVDETSRASTRFGGVVGYWKDEAAQKTASKPKFRQIELNLKKLIGLCYATDELLQDAAALESFIRKAFPAEFGFLLDDAVINGTGAGQPLGILNAGCLVSVTKEAGQKADTLVWENVVKMYARLFAQSRNNAVWLINQNVEPQLMQMSMAVGTGGVPVYLPAGGATANPYATLFGRPVIAIEQCQTLGDKGDIVFADLGGYILAEKGGIQADMSIHVQFVYDESVFRFVMRVDGQPERASALTPYKGSDSLSHFVTLDARA